MIEIPYSDVQIILLDRGYCDALFWSRFLRIQDACSQEQSDSLYGILQEMNTQFNLLPDWLFVIDVSVEESIKRRYALGGEIVIDTVDGKVIYDVKPGTQTDTKVRLKGKGVPSLRNKEVRGDHYVTLVIQVPDKLSHDAKELLKKFDKEVDNSLEAAKNAGKDEKTTETKKKKGFFK